MHQSVRDAFVRFSEPLEGKCAHMYLDVKGLVTTAIGNLIDPVAYAVTLPWKHPDGRPATQDEIRAEWSLVKGRVDLKMRGGVIYKTITSLRLDEEGIARVVGRKLDQNDDYLRRRFAAFEEWPADAQLATHSMAWACGPAFRFPMLEAALRAKQFGLAAVECRMQEAGNPGIVPRNKANRLMYFNASIVHREGLDPTVLHWPTDLTAERPTEPRLDDEETQPAVVPEVRKDPLGHVIVRPALEFPLRRYDNGPGEPPDDDAA